MSDSIDNDSYANASAPEICSSGPDPIEASYDPRNDEAIAQLNAAVRFAPWYLALTTTTTLWWSYLVIGEFVLSGLPEFFGWFVLLLLVAVDLWRVGRRFSVYLPRESARQRLLMLGAAGVCLFLSLVLAIVFGLFLPEPIATVLMFPILGLFALWLRRVRIRRFPLVEPAVPSTPVWRIAAKSIAIIVATLLAVAGALARM